ALDAYGNTATGYTGAVHFSGGGTGATLPPDYTFLGGDAGAHTFTNGFTLTQAGSRTITATDTVSGSTMGNATLTIDPASAASLSLPAPPSATPGTSTTLTRSALDAYGNTATGYTGTVHFSGGGTGATLPPDYSFSGADNGSHTFSNAFTLT